MKKLGFIGCGTMGKPMALKLIKTGYQLVVHDINPEPIKGLVKAGATAANSPREVAQQVEIVITVLPSSPHVEQVMYGPDGVLEGLKRGGVIIDMSTINPVVSRQVAASAAEKGIEMLDAPVSGGVLRILDGNLTIMVGGKKEVFEEYQGILQEIGKNTIYVGDTGMGEVVKLANQLLVGANIIAVCEAFLFGTKLGADPQTLYNVITKSSGNCFILEKRVPYPNLVASSPANHDFEPDDKFTTDLMAKDLSLCLSAADVTQFPLLTCSLAHQLLEAAKAKGLGKKDCTVVNKIIRQLGGEKV